MQIYEELKARGLIAQVTDEEQIRELVNNGKATFYIGFDCTADSLHVGHFMALCLMKRLQMAGNKPIALIGGGTTMIGDPSGRNDMRKMLTKEDIDHNAECFKRQMERFIEFGDGKAMMLNNADWLLKLNYIDLLREVGACFSVNNMLRAKCYEQRMEKGLSFLEFNYMIMQSYDFYHMFQTVGCNLQFGGDDQWSKLLGLDGIVAIGGDGTFRGAQDLSRFGVSVVGVPGTIDNDIVCTDYTIGFDTAANTAVECIDRLRDTMQSHERCSVVEVMGRHAGYLALYVGVAVGATAVLVPEHQYDFEKHVAEKIRAARLGGKTNFMIVVAEGAASAMDVGKEIKEHLGLDPRVTILGHIQRGGSPTAKDRVLATRMGYEAVRVLAEGMTNRVICVRDDQIVNVDIDEGLAMKKTLNAEEFEVMTVMTGV